MVIQPSTHVMADMTRRATTDERLLLTLKMDPSDTSFLNAYFDTWNTEFPPTARLPIGYNAQQVLYDMTVDDASGTSRFWETHVAPNLSIVHYSNPVKPWEKRMDDTNEAASSSSLQTLWETWYTKSQNFLRRHRQQVAERRRKEEQDAGPPPPPRRQPLNPALPPSSSRPAPFRPSASHDPRHLHRLIAKRFKELKRQGKSAKEAMEEARLEYGQGSNQEIDPGTAVAAMFGMR